MLERHRQATRHLLGRVHLKATMHKVLPLLFLCAITPACDAAENIDLCATPSTLELAPPDGVTLPSITLREQGPPAGLYVTELGGEAFFRDEFVKVVQACSDQPNPKLTATLSWYQPDLTNDSMVLGLGVSMMAPASLHKCWATLFEANGAVAF